MKALIDKPSIFFWIKRDFLSHHLLTKKSWFIVRVEENQLFCKCVTSDWCFWVVFREFVLPLNCFKVEHKVVPEKTCSNSDQKSRMSWTFSRTRLRPLTMKTRFTRQWLIPQNTHKGNSRPHLNCVTTDVMKW
jgi:hypothetical protein